MARKELKKGIERSKESSWSNLCRQVEEDPWGLPYRLVTKKLPGRRPIQGLTLPGRIESIVDTLFPADETIVWPVADASHGFHEISIEEIRQCARDIPTGKAPGPDGVPDMVVKRIAERRPEIFAQAFNQCLGEGIFPAIWKRADLVLLPKGNKPLDLPSSYRPICLLNTTGKLLERIIKVRLDMHLETFGGFSERQYGFRKGKSTIDAISHVMEVIDSKGSGPLYRRELGALLTLDVANAFNTARWCNISEGLIRKKVPEYLLTIIRSYMSDRSLVFGEDQHRSINRGVPQGSVIGPLLWNVMYDDLLRIDLGDNIPGHSSAELVTFADDVAVVVSGHNTELPEIAANRALEAVSSWMKRNGLTLAAHKTEAVVLTTKRGYQKPTFMVDGVPVVPKEKLRYLFFFFFFFFV
ncbi:Reverse transcriptase domain [Cinara cedri]|uniref:Reverse transcriptase domain n=1 Tax=Cinara cedri TaxID=506608 RepID=A0A5E4NCM5_9HEMI|nr:Reverse transcriptase domain [Cinara cedri]